MRAALPLRADRILSRIRDTRGGKPYDAQFGKRGVGEGAYARTIQAFFDQPVRRLGMNDATWFSGKEVEENTPFRRPPGSGRKKQLPLF